MNKVTPTDIKNWFAGNIQGYDAPTLATRLTQGQKVSLAKVAFQKEVLDTILAQRF